MADRLQKMDELTRRIAERRRELLHFYGLGLPELETTSDEIPVELMVEKELERIKNKSQVEEQIPEVRPIDMPDRQAEVETFNV